jgi:hypothetical protein
MGVIANLLVNLLACEMHLQIPSAHRAPEACYLKRCISACGRNLTNIDLSA